MAKDDDIFDENMGDNEDLIDFDLDLSDLATDGDNDEKTLSEEPGDDVIDLVDLVEKDSEDGEEDLLKLLEVEDDDIGLEEEDSAGPAAVTQMGDAESKKMMKLAKTVPEMDLPETDVAEDEAEGITTTLTDIDLSEIVDDQDLSLDEDFDSEEGVDEGAISMEDFDKTFEDTPASKLQPKEPPSEIGLEEDQAGPIEVDLIKPEDEVIEEDISENDMERVLEEDSIGEIDFDIETTSEEDTEISQDEQPGLEESIEAIDLDFGDIGEGEAAPVDFIEAAEAEPSEEIATEPVGFDLDKESEIQPEEPRVEEAIPEPSAEAVMGITEEKMEEIITRVVQDSVERTTKEVISELFPQDLIERVAREAMTGVAEKVITDAIDALKQSLETESE